MRLSSNPVWKPPALARLEKPPGFQSFAVETVSAFTQGPLGRVFDPNTIHYDPTAVYSPDGTLSPAQKVCDFLIRQVYQRPTRSTVYKWLGNPCPFLRKGKKLSCSEYALVMIHRFGVVRGIWEGSKRLLRCNPVTVLRGRYEDPVFSG